MAANSTEFAMFVASYFSWADDSILTHIYTPTYARTKPRKPRYIDLYGMTARYRQGQIITGKSNLQGSVNMCMVCLQRLRIRQRVYTATGFSVAHMLITQSDFQ